MKRGKTGKENSGEKIVQDILPLLFLVDMRQQSMRRVLDGVLRYAQTHPKMEVLFEGHPGTDEIDPKRLVHPWVAVGNRRIIEELIESGVATGPCLGAVLVNDAKPVSTLSTPSRYIMCDNEEIARAAADLFLAKGLRHFAYASISGGHGKQDWSDKRGAAFSARLAARSLTCHTYPALPPGRSWEEEEAALGAWLRALPKPCGIFAPFDIRAKQVLDACRAAGVSVPEQAMVIGVDDDELLCERTAPPLTSIKPDFEAGGFAAARLCAELAAGQAVPEVPTRYGIRGVVERASTQDVHGAGRIAATARAFLRKYAVEPDISSAEAARAAGCSLRLLQKHYRAVFGTTPLADLHAERLRRVCALLRDTDTPIGQVGPLCGFRGETHVKILFRRTFGCSMREWRRRTRAGG